MRVLQIYNQYRSRGGGETAVVTDTVRLLREHGHEVRLFERDSFGIRTAGEKMRAAIQGVYSFSTRRLMSDRLQDWRPDIVHVHNLYPLFSPSVLVACRRSGVPVVMTVHNYNLTCPTWYHLYKGLVCEDCVGGHEYRCVLKNCRNDRLESFAYALRSGFARRFRLFHDNVNQLIVLTPFAKKRLLQAGFSDDQIAVVPNSTSTTETLPDRHAGKYVAFAGRVSQEKGVDTLLAAAAQMPDVPFKVAGDGPVLSEMMARAPENVEFLGRLGADELIEFYGESRLVVVPSIWFEQFPMVVLEAMARGLPVIASRIGGLPEIIEEGITGSLFDPGNPEDLAQQVRRLWQEPELCNRMGREGRRKVVHQYSQDSYYRNLMEVYQTAIHRPRKGTEAPLLIQITDAVPRPRPTGGQ